MSDATPIRYGRLEQAQTPVELPQGARYGDRNPPPELAPSAPTYTRNDQPMPDAPQAPGSASRYAR
jgi:hypothetical protein